MDRRQFLWLTGAAGGAAMLASEATVEPPAGAAPEVAPGVETEIRTTCLMCPGGCGIKVRQVDGFPVGIRGNPNHPVNGGGVCSECQAALQMLYHPDRILEPMRRRGGKRSNPFEPVAWEEALEEIATALGELRAKHKPQKLAFVLGRTGGTMEELVRHFLASWGSTNLLVDEPQDGYAEVFEVMHGLRARPAFDFANTDLVLSFGADLLEAWQAPLQFQRCLASFRDGSRSSPARLVVVDARFSRTAARADEWVGISPGSYGALALGLAYVILREKLYNEAFAESWLRGLGDFRDAAGRSRTGFEALVLRDYSPEVVSRLTGVAVERILALGKAFGESATGLALFGEDVVAQPGGLYAAMAIHALNLLKGNINRRGGIYLQPEVPLSPLSEAAGARNGSSPAGRVENLAELPPEDLPGVVFLYCSNPVYSSPFGRGIAEALSNVPLVVSFSPFLDETCRFADFVLPDALFLERWEDRLFPPAFPAAGWSIVQPCAEPAGKVRHTGDVLLELARTLGATLAEACPWESFEALLKHRARGLYEARSGTLCVEPFQQGLIAEMERRGWWTSGAGSFEEFWQQLLEAGAWTDPDYQVRSLSEYSGHPDRRIDLHSRKLAERPARSGEQHEETECLPHYHAADAGRIAVEYPLTLHPYRLGRFGGGTNAILPWVLEGAGTIHNIAWNSWAEIHPDDARSLGIRNLDWIWVESTSGRIRLRAVLYRGTGRGVVNVPTGLGHKEMGRWASRRGANPLEIIAAEQDPLSGLTYRFGTKVKAYRA